MTVTRMLIVVDESPAAQRAVRYVGKVVGKHRGFHICLAHLSPPLPSELLETGGSENPEKEQRIERQMRNQQKRWTAAAQARVKSSLTRAIAELRRAGLPASAIGTEFSSPTDAAGATAEILDLAKSHKCTTVVIGRQSSSWLREIVHMDLAEQLLRHGKGFTFWVVE